MDCFAELSSGAHSRDPLARNDGWIQFRALATLIARGLPVTLPSTNRGRREDRVLAAPAVSRPIAQTKTHTSIQVQRKHSGLPCAVALRLMPCSPRRRIRLASVAAGLMADRSGWIGVATGSLAPATGVGTTRFCRTHQRRSSCVLCPLTDQIRPAITSHARR